MQIDWSSIGEKVYSILKGSCKSVSMYDAKGNSTIDPEEATRFFAIFHSFNKKLDDFTVLVACHNEGHESHIDMKTPNLKNKKDFEQIHQVRNHIRTAIGEREGIKVNWLVFDHAINPKDEAINNVKESIDESLKSFLNVLKHKLITIPSLNMRSSFAKVSNPAQGQVRISPKNGQFTKDEIDMMLAIAKRKGIYAHVEKDGNVLFRHPQSIREGTHMKKVTDQPIAESKDVSKVYGTTKSSFQQIGEAKLIIRHSAAVNENVHGARSRQIRALFVENKIGERFAYPHLHMSGARAFARHISNGGTNYDPVATKLFSLSEDYIKLRKSAHSLRLTESSNPVWIDRLKESMNEINRKLKSMHGPKGYKNATASMLEETSTEIDESAINDLRDKLAECCGCPQDGSMYNDFGTAAKYIAAKGPIAEPVSFTWKSRPDVTSRLSEFTSVAERLNWQLNELANSCANEDGVMSLQSIAEQIANGVMPNESDLNVFRRAYESSQQFVSEEVNIPEENELNEFLDTFSEENIFTEDATKSVYDAIWDSIKNNHQDLITQFGMKNVADAVNYETEQLSQVTQFDSNSVNVWIKNIIGTLENLTRKKYRVNEDDDNCDMTAEGEGRLGMPDEDDIIDGDDDEFDNVDDEEDPDYGDPRDYDDYDDRMDFADPGGNSALRAATPDNPRIHACPTCNHPNRLTAADVARGYHCDSCANAMERGHEIDYYDDPEVDHDLEGEAPPLGMDKDDLYESQVKRLKNLAGI